jgi:hypothetical protein
MDRDTKRNFQVVMLVTLLAAGGRTAWIFYQRHQSDNAPTTAAPERKLHADDYVYLRPSHVYDLASTKKFLVGKTVWVKAGNAVAFSLVSPPNRVSPCGVRTKMSPSECLLPPLAELDVKSVVMNGAQMYAITSAPAYPPITISDDRQTAEGYFLKEVAVPIGSVKNSSANIVIDDLFFFDDPHKLYDHWTKDDWAAIERHEITKGMSEAQAAAAMGVPHAPESGAAGEYGNRTLVFSDPATGKSVTVTFAENAAVSISKPAQQTP